MAIQILFVLPSFSQELFIRDVIAKPSKMVSPNAKSGDTQNDYQQERQIIDDYLKQINPNFLTGELCVITDLINKQHFRFDIFYKNVIVDGNTLTLHYWSDSTLMITGANLFSDDIETTPTLTKEQAVENLKLSDNRINDSTILSNELVIYKDLETEPYLCYKIEVALSVVESYHYYVSALNGNIIKKLSLTRSSTPEIGTAYLQNWGTQTIYTSFKSINNKYILFDQGANIQTYSMNGATYLISAENFTDLDNNWTLAEFPETRTYSMNAALVCHWGARKTYDFFFNTFNLASYNGNNKKINLYVNYGGESDDGDNAFWNPTYDMIQIGSGRNDENKHHYGVVDIVAHEFGHAVTDYKGKANLKYEGESGAIDEGLSDIWGACVENYLGATSYEIWHHGDHKGEKIRNLQNPNYSYYCQPDTYLGTCWVNTADTSDDNDHGGVHYNSGVICYWFYLLTMGGSGTNDNQEQYEVDGLGFSVSQRIVYQTLTSHLEKNSTFAQFRTSTLDATAQLYGETSNAYKQVMNAWHAVGVGHPYMYSNIEGDFGICDGGVYSIEVHPAVSVTWSVDKFNDIFSQKDKLTFVSGQGTNTIVVNRANKSGMSVDGNFVKYRGYVQLAANLTYGDTTITIYKTLFANNPLPEIQYTIKNQGSAIYVNNVYKFFVNNVATNFVNWKIIAGNNVYTAAATDSIVVTLPINRTYDVIVSVSDNGGCSSTNSKTLTLPKLIIPILSYENPVKRNSPLYLKKISEEPIDNSIYTIEIWNEYGLVRSEKYDDAPEFMVSTEGLIPSIYFIRIYRNGEFVNTQKLIIK